MEVSLKPYPEKSIKEFFYDHFLKVPQLTIHSPGRINLIGEHTDYNDGFVMPMAIDFSTWVALAPRGDRKIVMRSEDFSETFEFDLDDRAHAGGLYLSALRVFPG